MTPSSDVKVSRRSSAQHRWTIDLHKHDLAAEIALILDQLRIIIDEAAPVVGLEPYQLRGIIEGSAVAGMSAERLQDVASILLTWKPTN